MDSITRIGISPAAIADIARSGLEPTDIAARAITGSEVAATNLTTGGRIPEGYVIPYFSLQGETVPFYRVKVLNPVDNVKYKQPSKEKNYIYFPRNFLTVAKGKDYVIITEGEKKATCATKMGFPCVAVSGVDSWKTRSITLPKDTKLTAKGNTGLVVAQIPSGEQHVGFGETSTLAEGLQDLIDLCVIAKKHVIIVYDSDVEGGCKMEVQRAAATLGYELRYRGIALDHIRQVVLPSAGKKVGLDDFLTTKEGPKEFARLVKGCLEKRTAFPRHPNPRVYVSQKLQKGRLGRKEYQNVAMAVLAEIEATGRRLKVEGSQELHYFDEQEHTLYPVQLNNQRIPLYETPFGAYLYERFGLGSADKSLVDWLATLYTGERPIFPAETHKVITRPKEDPYIGCIAYQLNDSQYAIVTPDERAPLLVKDNGSHGILFEQGQVTPVDPKELEFQFARHLDLLPEQILWYGAIKGFNIRPAMLGDQAPTVTPEQVKILTTLLYYISPWLLRWRGTQLPIELMIGEAGSGKSSLMQLRQRVVTGKPYLSNLTTDIRDWYAGITARGGVHVLDNVHFTAGAKDFRQRLSDEICRLITEPQPHVEMRKLYTTNQVLNLPVSATMAVTSIEQPFYNTDLLQRASIIEFEALGGSHDADWVNRQLQLGGGRVGWVAHHLAVLHRFLELVNSKGYWDTSYKAKHRLANYEQCLVMMAHVLGMPEAEQWIPSALAYTIREHLTEGDWVHQALKGFIEEVVTTYPESYIHKDITVPMISGWCKEHDTYCKNPILTNNWKLGRYIQSHKQTLEETLGLYEKGHKKDNRVCYGIRQR